MLKLCEHLQADKKEPQESQKGKEAGCDSLQVIAVHLERRWHAIWLQSLEWQCRLEEAISRGKVGHFMEPILTLIEVHKLKTIL